ncbi:MAG: CDP-alcohol phosphatidyltransferase family protein [Bacteroidaceae bacterium]|nr:CDP-alcohol phosphatidyltransferase family protein [Bacteroidaceae bacterium]
MFIKKAIPDILTCCNLISGCIAVQQALSGHQEWAFFFIVTGAVFDFFDGFSARLLNVSTPIGKELDSLADVVTFGFAPSAIIFDTLRSMLCSQCLGCCCINVIPYVAFVMAAFSALRLAKFNLDERQTSSFIGLPTPANALFWASLLTGYASYFRTGGFTAFVIIIVLLILSCILLIAEFPMFALKFHTFRKWKGNEVRYIFIITSLLLIILLGSNAFAVIIAWYVLLSFINNQITKK